MADLNGAEFLAAVKAATLPAVYAKVIGDVGQHGFVLAAAEVGSGRLVKSYGKCHTFQEAMGRFSELEEWVARDFGK